MSSLILKLERSKEAFLSLRRLPGLAWRYSTSGAGENDSVAVAMPRVTSKSYLLVGRGVWLTVMIRRKKRKKVNSENIER